MLQLSEEYAFHLQIIKKDESLLGTRDSKFLKVRYIPVTVQAPYMVIKRFPDAEPLVTSRAIILAVADIMLISHVDLDMTLMLNKLKAHQTLVTIWTLVDLILQKEFHGGGAIICKE